MKKILSYSLLVAAVAVMSCKGAEKKAEETATAVAQSVEAEANKAVVAAENAVAATTEKVAEKATEVKNEAKEAVKDVKEAAKTAVTPEATAKTAPAADTKKTTVAFEEMNYNWGSVTDGDKVTHVFKFKNTGKTPLILADVKGSCSCTTPEWPKTPIAPGKSGEIKAIFDSKGKVGSQTKTVTVTANTDPAQIVLMIKGEVKAK